MLSLFPKRRRGNRDLWGTREMSRFRPSLTPKQSWDVAHMKEKEEVLTSFWLSQEQHSKPQITHPAREDHLCAEQAFS